MQFVLCCTVSALAQPATESAVGANANGGKQSRTSRSITGHEPA